MTSRELVSKIADEWDEEVDGPLTARDIRAKLLKSDTPELAVTEKTIQKYLKEPKGSQKIQIAQKKLTCNKLLEKCNKMSEELAEQLESSDCSIDDIVRQRIARLHIMTGVLLDKAIEEDSVSLLKEALKVYKDACNSILSAREINTSSSNTDGKSEGVERLLSEAGILKK